MIPPLGVYVHWPFCERICPYCDFNVYKNKTIDEAAWINALTGELEHWAARVPCRPLRSLYFGGGTPSLAPTRVIEAVIETCVRLWGFEEAPEITLEANPTSAEAARFESFASLGVNRLSLGVQSLRDDALIFLGRDHNAKEAVEALARALKLFPTSSFDLIYARPTQSLDDWRDELAEALNLGARHLSLYQLTIEEGTAFQKAVARGAWAPPPEGLSADMFDLAQERTTAAGLPAYEISNHAGAEAQSKHNRLYWQQGDYIGIGPGAHGRVTIDGERLATETHRQPSEYLKQVLQQGSGIAEETTLDFEARTIEHLSMGLRLVEGCTLPPLIEAQLKLRQAKIDALTKDGFLEATPGRLRATAKGRRVLNAVLGELLV